MEDDQILLADYTYISESLWRNEESGERRVNFFITLTTSVLGGIVALLAAAIIEFEDSLDMNVVTFALVGTLLFGIVTFIRILYRNKVTNEYKNMLNQIRDKMTESSSALKDYKLNFSNNRWMVRGGLREMVALMNCIIATALVGIWYPVWYIILATFMLCVLIQCIFIKHANKEKIG